MLFSVFCYSRRVVYRLHAQISNITSGFSPLMGNLLSLPPYLLTPTAVTRRELLISERARECGRWILARRILALRYRSSLSSTPGLGEKKTKARNVLTANKYRSPPSISRPSMLTSIIRPFCFHSLLSLFVFMLTNFISLFL